MITLSAIVLLALVMPVLGGPKNSVIPLLSGPRMIWRYAAFPLKRRLVIDHHCQTTTYDTGDQQISGPSQAQSTDSTLTFVSQDGVVRVSDLARADRSEPGRS